MDATTIFENFDEFVIDETSSDGDMASESKRKPNHVSNDSSSAAKKLKRNENDISNAQVEISSITGKKFENRNSNNISYINSV